MSYRFGVVGVLSQSGGLALDTLLSHPRITLFEDRTLDSPMIAQLAPFISSGWDRILRKQPNTPPVPAPIGPRGGRSWRHG